MASSRRAEPEIDAPPWVGRRNVTRWQVRPWIARQGAKTLGVDPCVTAVGKAVMSRGARCGQGRSVVRVAL